MNPQVLYEDEHMLALFKPAGMVTVPAPNIPEYKTFQGKVREWAEKLPVPFKPYLLNRLDKETSGIVLLGKFPRDREALESIFRSPTTEKIYLTLVKGWPKKKDGTITKPLPARTRNILVPAVSHYHVVEHYEMVALVEVKIETGRKHQIRQHLAKIGHPILMDRLYGDANFNRKYRAKFPNAQMLLHAARMSFVHPITGKKVEVNAGLG